MPLSQNCLVGAALFFIAFECVRACEVFHKPGVYPSSKQSCIASVTVSPMGGFLQLAISSELNAEHQVADDITSFAWIDEHSFIFSTGPIYGTPGIFVGDCNHPSEAPETLVNAANKTTTYPDGADYFQLHEIVDHMVRYYYSADVDLLDLAKLRVDMNLRSVAVPP